MFLLVAFLFLDNILKFLSAPWILFIPYPQVIIIIKLVIKPSASIGLCICILYHWTWEGHSRCSDVSRENIVTYAPCFLHTAHTHMLCLHWSSPISSSALYFKCIQCGVVVVYPLPWPLLVGGVRSSRLWSTSQLLRPYDQQCTHSCGVCPQIQGWQCGAYVGAVEEMMCFVCVNVGVDVV